jgi:hypothetical protein
MASTTQTQDQVSLKLRKNKATNNVLFTKSGKILNPTLTKTRSRNNKNKTCRDNSRSAQIRCSFFKKGI